MTVVHLNPADSDMHDRDQASVICPTCERLVWVDIQNGAYGAAKAAGRNALIETCSQKPCLMRARLEDINRIRGNPRS